MSWRMREASLPTPSIKERGAETQGCWSPILGPEGLGGGGGLRKCCVWLSVSKVEQAGRPAGLCLGLILQREKPEAQRGADSCSGSHSSWWWARASGI